MQGLQAVFNVTRLCKEFRRFLPPKTEKVHVKSIQKRADKVVSSTKKVFCPAKFKYRPTIENHLIDQLNQIGLNNRVFPSKKHKLATLLSLCKETNSRHRQWICKQESSTFGQLQIRFTLIKDLSRGEQAWDSYYKMGQKMPKVSKSNLRAIIAISLKA